MDTGLLVEHPIVRKERLDSVVAQQHGDGAPILGRRDRERGVAGPAREHGEQLRVGSHQRAPTFGVPLRNRDPVLVEVGVEALQPAVVELRPERVVRGLIRQRHIGFECGQDHRVVLGSISEWHRFDEGTVERIVSQLSNPREALAVQRVAAFPMARLGPHPGIGQQRDREGFGRAVGDDAVEVECEQGRQGRVRLASLARGGAACRERVSVVEL